MVLDMAKPKNKKSTKKPGMRGRDAARRVDSQGGHFTGIHDRFLKVRVSRESQLVIGWTELKCKEIGRTCKIRPYISSHSRGKEKIPRTMVSHLEQIREKWAYEASIRFSSCCLYEKLSTPRVRRDKLKSLFLQNNTGYGIPFQTHRGGTSLNGIGNELIRFF